MAKGNFVAAFIVRFFAFCLFAFFIVAKTAVAGPYILVDAKKGEVIAADRATDPWYPASITKLMTLYVAANAIRDGRLSMTSSLTMSKKAAGVAPSKMGFKAGTQVTMENAFAMLIVKSANDIAVGIAERVSGSEAAFVKEMNATARKIGMTNSHFTNPHGLPSKQQYVTARDMAVLGVAIQNDFPELAPLFGIPGIRHGKKVLRSFNLLLEHYRGATGMKTGFICSAGLNMVASAERGGKRYLAVILGEASTIDRTEKAALVLEHGFRNGSKNSKGQLSSYQPRATRSSPVNLRPYICGGHTKIRKYQLVAPQPKPKKKLFGKNKYVSPQRKDFGEGLGDKSHPQGTLVFAPRGRKYRSHILQPRREREILQVYAGAGRRSDKIAYSVNVSKQGRKRLAKNGGLSDVVALTAASGTPFPQAKPGLIVSAQPNTIPATASAFLNAQNGLGAANQRNRGDGKASLFNKGNRPSKKPLPIQKALPLDLKPSLSILEPRPNPVR